jgi:hypothetical protein
LSFLLAILVFECGALHLARQALYCLSQSPSPFRFCYFLNRVSHLCPG